VNALLKVGADVERAHGLEPFDGLGEVSPGRRLRPFAQPGERSTVSVAVDHDQRFELRNCRTRQPFDKVLVRPLARPCARR
jgi:hypothetical protein